MRQGTSSRRSRGRGNRKPHVPIKNQTFDSNGPEIRVRGNANQVLEKYLAMARDAQSAGDRISAENYMQHAEHYYRIINANGDGQNGRPRPQPHPDEDSQPQVQPQQPQPQQPQPHSQPLPQSQPQPQPQPQAQPTPAPVALDDVLPGVDLDSGDEDGGGSSPTELV